jgi:four helix bundle protein
MDSSPLRRTYDLEQRTETFAKKVQNFLQKIPHRLENREIRTQLLRSSTSVAANYIEANEALGKQDFLMHARISLKESKESRLWLSLLPILPTSPSLEIERSELHDEAQQLVKIFSTIIRNSQQKQGTTPHKPHHV